MKHILCSCADNAYVPYRFWSWKIMTKDEIKNKPEWHPYEGSLNLVPLYIKEEINNLDLIDEMGSIR